MRPIEFSLYLISLSISLTKKDTSGCCPNPPGDFIPSPLLRFALIDRYFENRINCQDYFASSIASSPSIFISAKASSALISPLTTYMVYSSTSA